MTADTVGGVWTYALELAQALQSYAIDVVLATMGAPLNEQQRTAVQQVANITLCESAWKLEWMEEPWDDVAAAGAWLLDLEALTQPDIVHLNGYTHGVLPWKSPTLSWAIPVCCRGLPRSKDSATRRPGSDISRRSGAGCTLPTW